MGINTLPAATSSAAIPGVGAVVASGTSSKGYVQISLAVGSYVAYVNTESLWGYHAPKSAIWGANYSSGIPTYFTITSTETIFTLGTRPITQITALPATSISQGYTPPILNGNTVFQLGANGTNNVGAVWTNAATNYSYMAQSGGPVSGSITGTGNNTQYASVANGVYFLPDLTTSKVMRSTNGTAWTSSAAVTGLTNTSGNCQVIFGSGNNYYCLVSPTGSSATNTVASSTDGVTWVTRSSANGSNALNGIAYANNIYVAVGAGGQIVTSTDSITWSSRTSGTTQTLYQVAHNGTRFVAFGDASDYVDRSVGSNYVYSTDGVTWTAGNISFSPNWTRYAGRGQVGAIPEIISIGGTFFCTMDNQLAGLAISPDGINWGIIPYASIASYAHALSAGVVQTGSTIAGINSYQAYTMQNSNGTLVQTTYTTNANRLLWPAPFSYTIYAATNTATN